LRRRRRRKKDCNVKPDLKEEIGASEASVDFLTEGYAQMNFNLENILFIFGVLQKIGVDWFRQQDQWVRQHAENRDAISLIPCHTILTGDQEFALAA